MNEWTRSGGLYDTHLLDSLCVKLSQFRREGVSGASSELSHESIEGEELCLAIVSDLALPQKGVELVGGLSFGVGLLRVKGRVA